MAAGAGVYGPYPRPGGWLVTVRSDRGGRTRNRTFATLAEAEREVAIQRAALQIANSRDRTIAQAIDAYADHLEAEGKKQRVETLRRIRLFFDDEEDLRLASLSPARCAALYDRVCGRRALRWVGSKDGRRLVESDAPMAATSQRGILTHAKTFLGWCVAQHWLRANPLAEVKPRGTLRHGKPQLRIDEARRWYATAMELAAKHDGAIAALCSLLLAMRATEIIDRTVRDLDDGGRLLWIPQSKTEAGRRVLEVPDSLRPLLLRLTRDRKGKPRPGDALLFGESHRRGWVMFWVKKICRLAGVPTVSAHAMRGLHATLATQAGATAQLVSGALGHASVGVTEQSYIAPGAAADAARRAGLAILDGGRRKK